MKDQKQQQQKEKGLFIPLEVLTNEQLNANEKIVLSLIRSYATFFMSQQKLADTLKIPIATIKRTIASLIKKNLLKKSFSNKYDKKVLKAINLNIQKSGDPRPAKIRASKSVKQFNECDKQYSEQELNAHFISEQELDNVEF